MDPKHLFFDERMAGFCVFCGRAPYSRDHCPSRILLDDPLPPNLPVVESCRNCNESFSLDEEYVACLLECVIQGSANPARLSRAKIQRILTDKPALAALIASGRNVEDSGDTVWQVDEARVARIVLKLARGHMAYELGLPKIELPENVISAPLPLLSETQRSVFEFPDRGSIALWPEIGSRAFLRAARGQGSPTEDWINIQPGRYRYIASQSAGDFVQIVFSEYLACRVEWD
jgi:hypothetical protein